MYEILSKLFGSASRVKIIRLFLLNPEEIFAPREVCKKARVLSHVARKELALLKDIDFIVRKKKSVSPSEKNRRGRHKKVDGWILNVSFPLLTSLQKLILNIAPFSGSELLRKINKSGRIKLVVLSGIFIQESNSRVDILVVGDSIKKGYLEKVLREVEAEIGKELIYAIFSTQDFIYRLGIYDKFVRDILDYPHEKILNKLEL